MLHVGKRSKVILTQSIYHMLYPPGQFTGLCDYSMYPHLPKQPVVIYSFLSTDDTLITRALQKQSAEFFHPPINLLSERREQLQTLKVSPMT